MFEILTVNFRLEMHITCKKIVWKIEWGIDIKIMSIEGRRTSELGRDTKKYTALEHKETGL